MTQKPWIAITAFCAFLALAATASAAQYTITDLGTLPGGTRSSGLSINASGKVVGTSATTGNAADHAFLYSGGMMIDLNSLIAVGSPWTLYEADGINDAGQITGIGNIGGHNHAFLLTPVPEPSSVVLSAFACAAILWRRKQSRSPRSGQRG